MPKDWAARGVLGSWNGLGAASREAVSPEGHVVPQQWIANTTAPGVAADDRRRLDLVIYGATPMGGANRPRTRSALKEAPRPYACSGAKLGDVGMPPQSRSCGASSSCALAGLHLLRAAPPRRHARGAAVQRAVGHAALGSAPCKVSSATPERLDRHGTLLGTFLFAACSSDGSCHRHECLPVSHMPPPSCM